MYGIVKAGFIRHMTGTSGGILGSFVFRQGEFLVIERLVASQDGLSSKEIVKHWFILRCCD
jgi:hypothetical protein